MKKYKRLALFNQLQRTTPYPKTELHYRSNFQLLISVILSAQATDESVNKATRELFRNAGNPLSLYQLGESELKRYIKSIGLYNSKAKNIIATCKLLLDNYKGQVPKTRSELEKLPGVGRKTANVILNTAFHEPTIAVDTHIFRVANRTGIAKGATVRAVEDKLIETTPKQYLKDAHNLLILHGRYTCKAKRPICCNCVINRFCEFPSKFSINRKH